MTDFERAIDAFAEGFSFTRSVTHPYLLAVQEHGFWILRDGPRRRDDYRVEEVISWEIPVADCIAQAHTRTQGAFRICYVLPSGASDTEMRRAFKEAGYRLNATEELFHHSLNDLDPVPPPNPISRVQTDAQWQLLSRVMGRRPPPPEHTTGEKPRIRQYLAMDGEIPTGWVASIGAGEATWCSSMYVVPAYRRRGIARSLLVQMLTDDREAGATANVLLASHAGSKLYPTVGYESLGTLYIYTPPKAK